MILHDSRFLVLALFGLFIGSIQGLEPGSAFRLAGAVHLNELVPNSGVDTDMLMKPKQATSNATLVFRRENSLMGMSNVDPRGLLNSRQTPTCDPGFRAFQPPHPSPALSSADI